jgi:hypothetical protein
MTPQRNQVTHGLALTVRNYRAVVWVYVFNLGLALLFSLRNYSQINAVLGHSLASQRLTNAFDLGTAISSMMRVGQNAPSAGGTQYLGLPIYLLLYFIAVPGTLFCYQTEAPATLTNLMGMGLQHFWRFVRITLLAGLTALIVLGPLYALNSLWDRHIDVHRVGQSAFIVEACSLIAIVLVGSVIRMYFDLVEVYTVQLGLTIMPNGKPDHRVRRALLPALQTLLRGSMENMTVFLFLMIVGSAILAATGSAAATTLAQPRAWPSFVLTQVGMLAMLVTRFWQRGAQTTLASNFPIQLQMSESTTSTNPTDTDPIPAPEPIAPALPEPDLGVFHHDPKQHPLPE